MSAKAVLLENESGLAILTLSRAAERNALSFGLLTELNTALASVVADETIQVALLRASGPSFSAGMDLKTVALEDPKQAELFGRMLAETYHRLLLLPIPLLCAVDGPALGGAVGLAMAADLIWAGPNARFAFPETRIGLAPALVSVVARRRLSPGKVAAMLIAGEEVGAADALRLGLVDFTATQSAAAEAAEYAYRILRDRSSEAMRRTKAFLQASLMPQYEKELESAIAEFRTAVATESCQRGLKAFKEKKPLTWRT